MPYRSTRQDVHKKMWFSPAHAVGVSLLNVLENLTGGRLVGSSTIEHRLCKVQRGGEARKRQATVTRGGGQEHGPLTRTRVLAEIYLGTRVGYVLGNSTRADEGRKGWSLLAKKNARHKLWWGRGRRACCATQWLI